jgi:hypothetical protein
MPDDETVERRKEFEMNRRTIGIILLSVLAIAGLTWAGFGLYEAGVVHGAAAEGSDIVVGRGYHYYPGFYGIGVIGIMFRAFFALLFFGLLARLFFFRPWAHYGGHRGPGGFGPGGPRHDEFRNRIDEHLTEWHDAAHSGAEQDSVEET